MHCPLWAHINHLCVFQWIDRNWAQRNFVICWKTLNLDVIPRGMRLYILHDLAHLYCKYASLFFWGSDIIFFSLQAGLLDSRLQSIFFCILGDILIILQKTVVLKHLFWSFLNFSQPLLIAWCCVRWQMDGLQFDKKQWLQVMRRITAWEIAALSQHSAVCLTRHPLAA